MSRVRLISPAQATSLNSNLPPGVIIAYPGDDADEWFVDLDMELPGFDVPTLLEQYDINESLPCPPVPESSAPTRVTKEVQLQAGVQYTYNHTVDGLAGDPQERRTVEVWKRVLLPGPKLTGLTAYNPQNATTTGAALIDGVLSSICYNNAATGPNGKWFGISLGSPKVVSAVRLFDYQSSAMYVATSWAVDTSDNGTTWVQRTVVANHTYSPNGFDLSLPEAVTCSYVRVRCITGINTSYWVLAEVDLLGPSPGSVVARSTDAVVHLVGNETRVTAATNGNYQLKVIL